MIINEIYFFRHAQTVWNSEKRFQGQLNSDLSEIGIQQAKKMSEPLKAINADIYITSSLGRTKDTLKHALKEKYHTLEVIEMAQFNEASFGSWEGMLISEVTKHYEDDFKIYKERPHLFDMTNAESYQDVQKRALQGVQKILERFPGKKIVVVTHGMTILSLCGYLRNIPIKFIREKVKIPDNTNYIKSCWYT